MSERRRPTLLLPPAGHPLDEAQLRVLREHFDLVEASAGSQAQIASGEDESITSIRRAGETLLEFSAEDLRELNAVQRIQRLQERIAAIVAEHLHYDHFEVRLTNPKTAQLELVIAVGIAPLGVGQQIYARSEDNGISGLVATSGRSYLCRDPQHDRRYTTGIADARSTLTVPLTLGGRVVGVFNIESQKIDAFPPRAVRCTEVLATYIALALHQLNLLVAERSQTRRAVAESMEQEISPQLDRVRALASRVESGSGTDADRDAAREIRDAIERSFRGLRACCEGPSSLLGVERALGEPPASGLRGRRVLVVDDDDRIRDNVSRILQSSGCEVIGATTGREALGRLDAAGEISAIDLVLTDVRLPDLTGYEVFRHAREHHPGIPVILMTGFGYDPHHSVVRASQEGLQSILFKPFQAQQLVEEIERACGVGQGE